MTTFERFEAILSHKKPDKMPFYFPTIACSVASEIMGREINSGADSLHFKEGLAWLDGEQAHSEFVHKYMEDAIELNRKLKADIVRQTWRKIDKPSKRIDENTLLFGDEDGKHTIKRFFPEHQSYGIIEDTAEPKDIDELKEYIKSELKGDVKVTEDELENIYKDQLELKKMADPYFPMIVPGYAIVSVSMYSPIWLEATILERDLVADYLMHEAEKYVCEQHIPWGANGYLRISKQIARLFRDLSLSAKIILSTWSFNRFIPGEWEAFNKAISSKPDWIDFLMADSLGNNIFPEYLRNNDTPGGLSILNFPEISMAGMNTWGGFGANPRPCWWQKYWDSTQHLIAGGFPYSEGIYEDINKILMLQLYWEPSRSVKDIVQEYVRGYFSPDVVEDVTNAIMLLEKNLPLTALVRYKEKDYLLLEVAGNVDHKADWELIYKTEDLSGAEECYALINKVNANLSKEIQKSWRWRILYLRVAIDAELARNNSKPNETIDAFLNEITEIYCCEKVEEPFVMPTRAAVRKIVKLGKVKNF